MIKWYSVFGMTKLILSAYGLLVTKAEMELHAGTFTKDSENKINWRKKTTYPSFLESRETILNRTLASRWADGVIYSELSHGNNSHAPCNICQIFSPGSCASDCCNLLPRASKLLATNHWKKYCSEELKKPHVLTTSIFETTGERWRIRLLRCTRTFRTRKENYITTCRTKSAPKMINIWKLNTFPPSKWTGSYVSKRFKFNPSDRGLTVA